VLLWIAVSVHAVLLFGGTTGKITGVVVDAVTKETLVGATIIIEGTKLGARANLNGEYTILNIPPGVYKLRISSVGYKIKTVENVSVATDRTTRINVELTSEAVTSEEVVIRAERPIIQKDQTSTTAIISGEQIQALPVENLDQVVNYQAGVVGGSFRGGRFGQVAYLIDGIAVQDVFDGSEGGANTVEPQAIQELQVITGAFNAEYGQAMSGVVNIVTKDGADKFAGNIMAYTGDYLAFNTNTFPNINRISPIATPNLQGSFSGPLIKDRLSFFVSGRYFENEGFLFGQRQYEPADVLQGSNPLNPFAELPGQQRVTAIRGRFVPAEPGSPNSFTFRDSESGVAFPDVNGRPLTFATDANGRLIIDRQNGTSAYIPYTLQNADFRRATDNYQNLGTGDNSFFARNPLLRGSGQAKLTFRATDALRFSYNILYEYEKTRGNQADGFDRHIWQRTPDGDNDNFRTGLTQYLTMNYTLNSTMFMTASVSRFFNRFRSYRFEDPFDPNYLYDAGIYEGGFTFAAGGMKTNRFERSTQTMSYKTDLTMQLGAYNLVKVGAELKMHTLFFQTIQPQVARNGSQAIFPFQVVIPAETEFGNETYTRNPREFAAYIQDKLEFDNLVINVGLRLDYFSPSTQIPRVASDPSTFFPILPDSEYVRRFGAGGRFVDVSAKYAISPRLSAAMPLGDKTLVRFAYGEFFQMPPLNLLYVNALYKFSEADLLGFVPNPIGNPDMRPQQTTNAEIGIQQQLGESWSLELTAYLRDIRNLVGSGRVENFVTTGQYFLFDNGDYGNVKGAILRVGKRLSQSFSTTIDYTFQFAEANAVNPSAASIARFNNLQPETRLLSVDTDQRHTLNGTVIYASNGWNIGLFAFFGTGFPYTPSLIPEFQTGAQPLLNSATRQPTFQADFRATRDFKLGGITASMFLQVFNLFDNRNEVAAFSTTGRANRELLSTSQRQSLQVLNSRNDFLQRPDFYQEPRRVSLGMTLNF
jgi:outer membrane receptor protein involved in Fe transport